MKFSTRLFIINCLLFASCNTFNQSEPNGVPCNYDTKIYPAKVIAFETRDSIHIDVLFQRTRNELIDTFNYSSQKHEWFTKQDILADSIKIGNIYQWREDHIVSGHCNPTIYRLIMKIMK